MFHIQLVYQEELIGLGKTYEKLGNKEKSDEWFKEGSKYLTTYYGQLSHMKDLSK